jgi:hypothetical protein
MSALNYKGYIGRVEFDPGAEIFHGRVVNVKDVTTFEGRTVDELKKAILSPPGRRVWQRETPGLALSRVSVRSNPGWPAYTFLSDNPALDFLTSNASPTFRPARPTSCLGMINLPRLLTFTFRLTSFAFRPARPPTSSGMSPSAMVALAMAVFNWVEFLKP